MTAITQEHIDSLNKTKIRLMSRSDSAFFTTLCFSLKHKFNPDIPTAQSNDLTIEYNPDFWMKQDDEEKLFLMLHETMHPAYLHGPRLQKGMNFKRANIAMDHVINLQLIDRGFKMPKGGHADPRFRGMHWEAVYKLLPESDDEPMMQDVMPSNTPEKAEKLIEDMTNILMSAAIQSKASGDKPGTIPGDIEIYLDELLNPKLPWNRIFQKYFNKYSKQDYSYRRPNKRFFPSFYLPTLYSKSLINLAIALDTSASVNTADFTAFIAEVATILAKYKPAKITLVQFDTRIKAVNEIKNTRELMNVNFVGRGGTSIAPVMKWVEENRPELLLIFSDGEFSQPDIKPASETLLLIHNNPNFKSNYGKVIHYENI
jgi:predicted metal-dependent peptidase